MRPTVHGNTAGFVTERTVNSPTDKSNTAVTSAWVRHQEMNGRTGYSKLMLLVFRRVVNEKSHLRLSDIT